MSIGQYEVADQENQREISRQEAADYTPTFDEVVEALVAVIYEDCTGTLGPDTVSRMGLLATTAPEIRAVKVLERLDRVKNVREVDGNLRADWGKSDGSED